MTDLSFEGRRVLVTGAARGIGRGIAEAFARRGASVALVDLLEEVHETARKIDGETRSHTLDVTDAAAVKKVVGEIIGEFDGLDVLVNNAGITRDTLLPRMSPEEFETVVRVNLTGTFLMTRAVARPMMKARGGHIVNIASVIGLHGNAGQANYAASKGGVIALTKAAAKELAGRGITVNAVAPGFVSTAMTDRLPEKVREQMRAMIPLGRFGEVGDVVGVVLFLAGALSAYVTGQVVVVDGGMFI